MKLQFIQQIIPVYQFFQWLCLEIRFVEIKFLIDGKKTDLENHRVINTKEGKMFAQKHLFEYTQKITENPQMPYFLEGSAKCKSFFVTHGG